MSEILVVGSVAYDSISTPVGRVDRTLGGSANYFSLVAEKFAPVRVVGVVGEDYAEEDLGLLADRNVDLTGLQKQPGRTFQWSGQYEADMNEAQTLATELNVFESFDPTLPASYRDSEVLFLANIDPELQLKVLSQVDQPRIVAADTMNYWIDTKKESLFQVLKKIQILLINEGEAKSLTGESNAIAAAQKIVEFGPEWVVIKRGEYGFVLYGQEKFFILPAFPIAKVVDPTGAGDSFAGGFLGDLTKTQNPLDWKSLKRACIHGCLLASFTVEDFGLERLKALGWTEVEQRMKEYFEVIDYQ